MPLANDQPPTFKIRSESKIRIERLSSESDSAQAKFPRIEECAHFHYESVDHGSIKLEFVEESAKNSRSNRSSLTDEFNYTYSVGVTAKNKCWVVKRNLSHFLRLDQLLHECVFDRKYSCLPVLKVEDMQSLSHNEIHSNLCSYLARLSEITDSNIDGGRIFCAPVLHWFEIDNHGRTLVSHALGDVADINIPAVAAARVVRRYQAQAADELSLNVGDMVSIIEMPLTGWWRGKQGLKVGYFPSQCVKKISSATDVVGTHQHLFIPPKYTSTSNQMPISKKHGKIMVVLRSFLDTRPAKSTLKKKGILRERVFGCDLGELLHRIGKDVPTVVSDCTRFVEKHGVVDGIYRISGVASHIRHLKYEFDSDQRPDLESKIEGLPELSTSAARRGDDESMMCDPHSVAGLCKLFFRELPNPLLTYQLYNRFATAVSDYEAEERLLQVHDAIQQLPPPHYRTLKHLICHLQFMAQKERSTSMHCRNLAIVWAPNLLRSREIEAGLAAFTEARVQSVVVEFLIANADLLFSEKLQTKQYDAENKPPRPKSLMVIPANKLISLQEAQARSKSGIVSPILEKISPSQTGVRMRDWTEKSTSERRKRRQKKSTSTNIVLRSESPRASRAPRKFGHRQTHSVYEANFNFSKTGEILLDVPSPSKPTSPQSSWKEKLGNFLKKSQPQSTVTKQASLRRTKSDDSLFSSSSQKQANDETEKKRRPKSLYADRHNSEPQFTFREEEKENSPARSRKKQTPKKGSPSKRRAKRTESEAIPVKQTDSFKITYRKVNHRNTVHGSEFSLPPEKLAFNLLRPISPDREPSPSPFSELASDFPNVMGEGIDFDPLSYRSKRHSEPHWPDIVVPPYKPANDESSKAEALRKSPSKSDPARKVNVSVKRVESVRSVHGEPIFAAVSSIVPTSENIDDKFKENNRLIDPDNDSKPVSSTKNVDDTTDSVPSKMRDVTTATCKLSVANQSTNNNIWLRDDSVQTGLLDGITAESFSDATFNPTSQLPQKISAAEKLGIKWKSTKNKLSTKRSSPRRSLETSTNTTKYKLDEAHPKSPSYSMKQTAISPSCNVQVYDMPTKSPLCKDADHYGSFIALVGTSNDLPVVSPPLSARENNVSPISPILVNPKKEKKRSFSQHRHEKPKQLSFTSKISARSGGESFLMSKSPYSPRLETFNPDGKTRKGYYELNLSPRYPKAHLWGHSQSKSCDSSPMNHTTIQQNQFGTTSQRVCENQGVKNEHSSAESSKQSASYPHGPKPAPRHFRSYSAGDCIEQTDHNAMSTLKPMPMPRRVFKQSPEVQKSETPSHWSSFESSQLDQDNCESPFSDVSNVQYVNEVGVSQIEQRSTSELHQDVSDYTILQNVYEHTAFVKEPLVG